MCPTRHTLIFILHQLVERKEVGKSWWEGVCWNAVHGYEPRGSLSVFLFFFQIQDLVVGPGGKISLTYSRVTGKEVELLTRERKPVERKLGFDLYTLKILQNTVLFLHEYEVN